MIIFGCPLHPTRDNTSWPLNGCQGCINEFKLFVQVVSPKTSRMTQKQKEKIAKILKLEPTEEETKYWLAQWNKQGGIK